jgi:hypothetical protein
MNATARAAAIAFESACAAYDARPSSANYAAYRAAHVALTAVLSTSKAWTW